jgi:hypothetical protein
MELQDSELCAGRLWGSRLCELPMAVLSRMGGPLPLLRSIRRVHLWMGLQVLCALLAVWTCGLALCTHIIAFVPPLLHTWHVLQDRYRLEHARTRQREQRERERNAKTNSDNSKGKTANETDKSAAAAAANGLTHRTSSAATATATASATASAVAVAPPPSRRSDYSGLDEKAAPPPRNGSGTGYGTGNGWSAASSYSYSYYESYAWSAEAQAEREAALAFEYDRFVPAREDYAFALNYWIIYAVFTVMESMALGDGHTDGHRLPHSHDGTHRTSASSRAAPSRLTLPSLCAQRKCCSTCSTACSCIGATTRSIGAL